MTIAYLLFLFLRRVDDRGVAGHRAHEGLGPRRRDGVVAQVQHAQVRRALHHRRQRAHGKRGGWSRPGRQEGATRI